MLFDEVNTKTQHLSMLTLAKMTFKKIAGLCITTHDNITELLMNVDLEDRIKEKSISAQEKWSKRKGEMIIERQPRRDKIKYDLDRIPVELIQVMNLSKRRCKICPSQLLRISHLKDTHHLSTPRSSPEDD